MRQTDTTIQRVEGGFPHSEIPGSKLVRSSPRLIAAYHVLHRLSAPRHPPNALKALDRSHDRCPVPTGSRYEADDGRPATVTIKTSDQAASRPPSHMLAEHDLQQATRFRGACGHIPSSRCSISMPPVALSAHKGKLLPSLRISWSVHRLGAPCGTSNETMVETDGIEPTT